MRRKEREMPEAFALEVVDKCMYATLATAGTDGQPYCVPVSVVRDGRVVYIHCAMQGRKTDNMRDSPKVCISCVGDVHLVEDKFTVEYESAVIFGRAEEVTADEEKTQALKLICERFAPSQMQAFDQAVQRSLHRTAVWKVQATEVTGKRKKYDHNGEEMKFGRME